MKNKKQLLILLSVVLLFTLVLLVSCQNNGPVDLEEYIGDDNGNSQLTFMGNLVKSMHSWIGNYGWTVVVFTVFLKILMLPVDLWQRIGARKSAVKMQRMQPIMESIDKRYGANTQKANEEKQKLYKKQGYSVMGSCLPMLLSMAIFLIIFGGLNNYATYNSVTNFNDLYIEYERVYYTEGAEKTDEWKVIYEDYIAADKSESEAVKLARRDYAANYSAKNTEFRLNALEQVGEYYKTHHESWLWIQNVWRPDTWEPIMQKYSSFKNTVSLDNLPVESAEDVYTSIRNEVVDTASRSWNGLMILPILSVGLSFLSIWISQRLDRNGKNKEKPDKNDQQAMTNKTMMIIMPLMMAFFGFLYTGAFAIYMAFNYALSIIATVALKVPVEKIVDRSLAKADAKNSAPKASYKR